MDVKQLLNQIKSGECSVEEGEALLKTLPYEDLGYAKLDHHRALRSGMPEVIFCSGKSTDHLVGIYQTFHQRDQDVLGTRATPEQFHAVAQEVPGVDYDPISRVLKLHRHPLPQTGQIAVCTGGTSDIGVAEEAAQVAEFFGCQVERVYDVGVAGIHRLLSKVSILERANCIVAVAGMEGALAGVVAGLVSKPVIAVPTSIGYGANFGGLSALLTMLNACAEGVAVVNIDNGFGAGYLATQINKMVR